MVVSKNLAVGIVVRYVIATNSQPKVKLPDLLQDTCSEYSSVDVTYIRNGNYILE
jgi:hypothetical protein